MLFLKISPLLIVALFGMILLPYATALDESLILYLPLDGNAEDRSSYRNDGKVAGNAQWADGKIGGCIELIPGSHIEVPEIPVYDVTDAVTLMAWIKTSTVTSWARIIDKSQWPDNGFDLALNMILHVPMFEFFVNGTTFQVNGTTRVDDDRWHFVAGTFGNKRLRIYVDGTLEGESTSTSDIKPNDWPIWIGDVARPQETQQYIGKIDEVAIFNRELSEEEIKNIYENGITISPVSLRGKLAITWGSIRDL